MMRLFFIAVLLLTLGYLVLQGRTLQRNDQAPAFLQSDTIADKHQTAINIQSIALLPISPFYKESLQKDYANIWAHLNHLYNTNDIEAGKEYYTESFFKQLNRHYTGIVQLPIRRNDLSHQFVIQNWSPDGLVCTAIDSNVVVRYTYPDQSVHTETLTVAVVLLFQGDHWRLDAMSILP